MGILETVVSLLRQGGFPAELAYPGRRVPQIAGPVAAVSLTKADWEAGTVTVEAAILAPAALGAGACQEQALRAGQLLRQAGAACVQAGCSYDGLNRVYCCPVLAVFSGVLERTFQVYAGQVLLEGAVSVTVEESRECQPEYAMGQEAALGLSTGKTLWTITVEERYAPGEGEPQEAGGEFSLRVLQADREEIYPRCRWVRCQKEITGGGLRRVRRAVATEQEVQVNGSAAV